MSALLAARPTPSPDATAHDAAPARPWRIALVQALAGVDAGLVATCLGLLYALVAYGALGPAALPMAVYASAAALLVGGLTAAATQPGRVTISGPTATGSLVIAALVLELQNLPELRGRVEPVVLAVAGVCATTAVVQCVLARLCLGVALKFLPYPVVSGFANAVGLLLMISVLPSALGHAYPGRLVQAAAWLVDMKIGAVVVATAGTVAGWLVTRWWKNAPSVVVALLVGTLVHKALQACGLDSALGPTLPLGPPGLARWPDPAAVWSSVHLGLAYWALVLKAGIVTALLNSLFAMVNCARMADATDPPLDGDRLLASQGAGNLAAALVGGLPVSVVGSVTAPLRRAPTGAPAARPWWGLLAYAAVIVALLGLGQQILRSLPMAAVAASVFLGAKALFDTSTPAFIQQALRPGPARREALGHVAISAAVVAVALLHSLASALFVGALAALVLLTLELRRGVVVSRSDLGVRRSRRARSDAQSRLLHAAGKRVRIVELGHWLYFGSVDDLGDVLQSQPLSAAAGQGPGAAAADFPRWLVLDMRRVAGIDVTAARSLVQAAQRLAREGTRLVLAGLAIGDLRRGPIELLRATGEGSALALWPSLDEALESLEDELLGTTPGPQPDAGEQMLPSMPAVLAARLRPYLGRRKLAAGETLFTLGSDASAMYMLSAGSVRLWVSSTSGEEIRLLSVGPLVGFGELGLMDGGTRTASARAEVDSDVLVLTREALARIARDDAELFTGVIQAIAVRLASRLRETTTQLGDSY